MTALDRADELKARTKQFAIRIVQVFRSLPRETDAYGVGKQLLRSGTSVAANYRAVCRARSKQEFGAKMGIVVEEADETVFWLEMQIATGIISRERAANLLGEGNELLAMFAAYGQAVISQSSDESMAQYSGVDGLRGVLDDTGFLAHDSSLRGPLAQAPITVPGAATGVAVDVGGCGGDYLEVANHCTVHVVVDVDRGSCAVRGRNMAVCTFGERVHTGATGRTAGGPADAC